jgi:hypothetical protein
MNSNAEERGGHRENQNWVIYCPENLRKKRRFLEIAVQRDAGGAEKTKKLGCLLPGNLRKKRRFLEMVVQRNTK